MSPLALSLASVVVLSAGSVATSRARGAKAARSTAVVMASIALAFGLVATYVATTGRAPSAYDLDGIAAPFVPFASALVLLALLAAPTAEMSPEWASRTLLSGVAIAAFFIARAPLLVWALWTLSSLPTYLELRSRADSKRGSLAARAFAAHGIVSSAFVGLGLALDAYGPSMRAWSVPVLVLGILARKGALPFHSWVPSFYEEAPLGAAALFAQAQAGGYLLVRVMVTDSVAVPTAFLDLVGIATALYGAMLASVQPTARRALGYFSLSQSALVFTGIAEGGVVGVGGSVLMILGTGLAQAGFTAALWCLEARRGALRIDRPSGGHDRTPGLAGAFLFLGLASVGLPGTLAFVAEDLVFHAALAHRPWVGLGMVCATALNGILVLRLFFALFGGARRAMGELDLLRRERVALVGLSMALVALGFAPGPLLSAVENELDRIGAMPVERARSSADAERLPDAG
jgi:NADH-quinone oxidoreductase subunit M